MKSGQINCIWLIRWTQRRHSQKHSMQYKQHHPFTILKHTVGREERGILRGMLTNWLLDPSLMRRFSFTFLARSLSFVWALSDRVELDLTLQPLNKWLKAVWPWVSKDVCQSWGKTKLILSQGDSGKDTLSSRAGEVEHSELMADLREVNDKVSDKYERECGKGEARSWNTCKSCGNGFY